MRGAPRAYRARRPPTVLYKFLVWEEHAAQFGVEFSECAGANILSVGQTSTKATHDLKLVTVQLPAGYVSNTQAARPQRFVNERVQLTEAGQSDLAWQTQESNRVGLSLPMWRDRHLCLRQRHSAERLRCAHCSVRRQNTYSRHDRRCPGDEARERHEMDTNRACPHGWACTSDTVTGAVKLRAAGCQRQCGGVCACPAACVNQVKKRHGCDLRINYERTLSLVQQGLVHITEENSKTRLFGLGSMN